MASLFPIHVNMPSGVSGNAVVGIPAFPEMYVINVGAYLRALTTGPYQIQVRDPITSVVIYSFTFNSAGIQESGALDVYIPPTNGLVVDIPQIGTGAGVSAITIWCQVP